MSTPSLQRAVSCRDCSLARLCLPTGLDTAEMDRLDSSIRRRGPLRRGQHLFDAGQPGECLYAVRAGAVKSIMTSTDGTERVLGVHLPGELIGLDAMGEGRHACTAVALESTSVCALTVERLRDLCTGTPRLFEPVFRLLGEAMARDRTTLVLLGQRSAEARMAGFLLNLSARLVRRGYARFEFNLSLTRREIASYLGLALGTVCRILAQLEDRGILEMRRRNVRILDPEALQASIDLPAA